MDMLTVTGLYKKFGDKEVLRGLDLFVPEHSIYGFIGKNGAGKTTAMKTVLGLIPADRGEIYVGGERVLYGETATNRLIGYLPDVPEFYSFMTAREYLLFCADISGIEKHRASVRADELLELVGLKGESHRIKGFSRGMKQRLGIAQALLGGPKLLICDEPTSALDPIGRKEILDILLKVAEHSTVLLSTHILSDVERICTDVAFLSRGCAQIHGSISEIKTKYRSDEYLIESETMEGVSIIADAFPGVKRVCDCTLTFLERDHGVYEVLRFISEKKLPIVRFEKVEPTLESLFMEAIDE